MSIEERLDLERNDRRHEGTLARLGGRLKSACCPICGGVDGMQATHREVLAQLDAETVTLIAPWYLDSVGGDYLFHACDRCNKRKAIPAGYVRMRVANIPAWLDDANLIQPDYAALARKEPVSQITDARESAGLEG